MKTGRYHCVTQKLSTAHGSVFIHVDHDAKGKAISVAFSQAQKFEDTEIGQRLDAVAARINLQLALGLSA